MMIVRRTEKKRFTPKKKDENDRRLTKESTTDPESGYYVKGEREKQFAYSFHTACDRNGFVLGTIVTPGNIHDSIILNPLLELIIHRVTVPFAVVADSAYKTAPIAHLLLRQRILPVFPYTRPRVCSKRMPSTMMRITIAISVKMISSLSIEQLHGNEDGSTYQIQKSVKLVHF